MSTPTVQPVKAPPRPTAWAPGAHAAQGIPTSSEARAASQRGDACKHLHPWQSPNLSSSRGVLQRRDKIDEQVVLIVRIQYFCLACVAPSLSLSPHIYLYIYNLCGIYRGVLTVIL